MKFSNDKEINKTVGGLIRDHAWTLKRASGHVRVVQPGTNQILTVPSSPSCQRAAVNWHAQLRRMIRAAGGVMPNMRGFA